MIDDEWLRALGRAVLYFSFVEIAVVSMVNSLDPTFPSYMETALNGKKPAGQVAQDFLAQVGKTPEGSCRSELEGLATRFAAAVRKRNDIVHAMPASFGDQTHLVRLTRDRFIAWSTAALVQVATEFEKLADDLSAAHYRMQPK